MDKLHIVFRFVATQKCALNVHSRVLQRVYLSSSSGSSSSSSSSSSDEDSTALKLQEKRKSEDALNKLNELLKTMIEEDVSSKTKLDLARPIDKRKSKVKEEPSTMKPPEVKITDAVKEVAETIGGDVKKTESELLMKLLNVNDKGSASTATLIDIVKEMKVEREEKFGEISKAEQVKKALQQRQFVRSGPIHTGKKIERTKIDLFGSEPLGIFTSVKETTTQGVRNETWEKLYEKDLKLAITHPPSNYFQQMTLWTEQGKVWKFPIDNEYGLDEESKVYFAEHVFLDQHLDLWCPRKGPIRHFMELVCVGLSKNPYLTVEAKKEHIEWFRNYFEEKKQLLREVGLTLGADDGQESVKQIDQ